MLFCQMHNSNGTLICVCTEVHAYNVVVVVAAVSAFNCRHCMDMAAVKCPLQLPKDHL